MKSPKNTIRVLTALLIPATFAACGDDSTGPETEINGSVSARMHDGSSSALMARAMTAQSFAGSASGQAQVQVYSEAQGWVALGSPVTSTVQLQSSSTTTLYSSASIPVGTYTRVRLVMDGFNADVSAGATLGGLTLSADVRITMGGADGMIEIEKTVTPFTVSATSSTTIDFDLNSEAWIDEESANAEAASDTEVESATTAVVTS